MTLGLLNPLSGKNWVAPEITSAAKLAVQYINNNTSMLPNAQLQLVIRDSACDPVIGSDAALQLLEHHSIDAFIGPGCSGVR